MGDRGFVIIIDKLYVPGDKRNVLDALRLGYYIDPETFKYYLRVTTH